MGAKKNREESSGLVYSTEGGRMCPGCSRPKATCNCKTQIAAPSGDQIVRIGHETKGRKGKGVTLISGIPLVGVELTKLAKTLKKRCGSGGTVKNGVIEIQGDHRTVLEAALLQRGYTVKRR